MSEVSFVCKVVSVHPSNDPYGNEFVCVEFALEAQRPPNVVQLPANVPQEISALIPLLSQIPKILPFGQARSYANRLLLYLTPQEWDRIKRKYQFGDEAEVKIAADGSIHLQVI